MLKICVIQKKVLYLRLLRGNKKLTPKWNVSLLYE